MATVEHSLQFCTTEQEPIHWWEKQLVCGIGISALTGNRLSQISKCVLIALTN